MIDLRRLLLLILGGNGRGIVAAWLLYGGGGGGGGGTGLATVFPLRLAKYGGGGPCDWPSTGGRGPL